MSHPKLTDLINYKNERILSRYHKDYPEATMAGEEALSELMKFIWLCLKHKDDRKNQPSEESLQFSCIIHAEMADIDNMWHTFLLFTRDYHQFCRDYLDGNFFHHQPILNNMENDPDEIYETELTLYLSYIYDKLGEETLNKWFRPQV